MSGRAGSQLIVAGLPSGGLRSVLHSSADRQATSVDERAPQRCNKHSEADRYHHGQDDDRCRNGDRLSTRRLLSNLAFRRSGHF
jgi:hypothetical protein